MSMPAVTSPGRVRYEWQVEQEAVLPRLRPRPGMRLLDAGCGIGHISLAALRRGCEVFALDFAHARLRHTANTPPRTPGCGTARPT